MVATTTVGGCVNNMSGSATISINPLPTTFTVTGGGTYCSGGTGVTVGLGGSQTGVNYQLYRGTAVVGSPVGGTGSAITFGLQTIAGTYTVVGTNPSTGCVSNMTGYVTVTVASLPSIVAMTGGGGYCTGGTGVHVGLAGSVTGVNYQLYLGTTPVGSPHAGIGGALDFGLQTAAGTYTAIASNSSSSCSVSMSGSATVYVYSTPAVYTVTGGGSYCAGGTGVHIGISGSSTGVSYRLYLGSTPVGSPVSGTGSAIDFGLYTAAGTYTVIATASGTGCISSMSGSATITINPVPTVSGSIYTVMPGASITYVASITGGIFSSSNTSIATVGGSTGVVTGVSLGTCTIYYVLPTGCANYHTVAVTTTGHKEMPIVTTQTGSNINVMPNPGKGVFTVRGSLASEQDAAVSLEITDMTGRVVYTNKVTAQNGAINELITLSNVANGMYILSLRSEGEHKVFHIVVEQ